MAQAFSSRVRLVQKAPIGALGEDLARARADHADLVEPQASGRFALVATLLLISFGIIPVVAVQSPDVASAIAFFIFRSGVVAVLWVWLVFALFPSVAPPGAERASVAAVPEPPEIVRRAAIDAAILLPVIVLAMTFSIPAVVLIVLTVTAVLRQHSLATGRRVALAAREPARRRDGADRLQPLGRSADAWLPGQPPAPHRAAVQPAGPMAFVSA